MEIDVPVNSDQEENSFLFLSTECSRTRNFLIAYAAVDLDLHISGHLNPVFRSIDPQHPTVRVWTSWPASRRKPGVALDRSSEFSKSSGYTKSARQWSKQLGIPWQSARPDP
jgi:hypothetical protein